MFSWCPRPKEILNNLTYEVTRSKQRNSGGLYHVLQMLLCFFHTFTVPDGALVSSLPCLIVSQHTVWGSSVYVVLRFALSKVVALKMEFLATRSSVSLCSVYFAIILIVFACIWLTSFLIEVLPSFAVHRSCHTIGHSIENEIVITQH